MNSEFEREITGLVNSIREVEGVVYISLYGSCARGDCDEGSDIDVLVLFQDLESMKLNRGDLLRRAVRFKMFLQITIFTMEEFFNDCNPVFVRGVMREGRMLYQRESEKMGDYLRRFAQMYPELVAKD